MPNIASILKSEISRVARKELRGETQALKKSNAQYRTQIAELKRRLQALEQERDRSNNLEVEFGQLQLEMSSWAAHTRIEKIAREKLGMQPPDMKKVQKLGVGQ